VIWHPVLGAVSVAVIAPSVAGCDARQTLVEPDPHLERMLDQPKVEAYEQPMRRPPEGTVPADRETGDPLVRFGTADGRYATKIPVPVTREMVETGRARFETFCAACHGLLGDGNSAVAENFQLRKPRSLQDEGVRKDPPGRTYQVISEGYGFMPSYDVQLSIADRWAVVAYVRALQLSRNAPVATLPPDVRAEVEKEAR
jgi:mono/diheme cytochrome c family protein